MMAQHEAEHFHNVNVPHAYPKETFWQNAISDRIPFSLKLSYLMIAFECGTVCYSTVVDVTTLASNCGISADSTSNIFLVQTGGALIGNVLIVYLLTKFHGNALLCCASILQAPLLIMLPFITSTVYLYGVYTLIGFFNGILMCVANHMLRRILAHHAGAWISLAQLCLYGAGSIISIVGVILYYALGESTSNSNDVKYGILGTMFICLGVVVMYVRDPEVHPVLVVIEHEPNANGSYDNDDDDLDVDAIDTEILKSQSFSSHLYVEMILGLVMVSTVGSSSLLLGYLITYSLDYGLETYIAGYIQVTISYIFSVISAFAGFLDQATNINNDNILHRMTILCCISGTAMILPLMFPYSVELLWIAVIVSFICCGPMFGYVYDWLNRATFISEAGTSIVTFGINAGGPVIISCGLAIWKAGFGPKIIIYVAIIFPLLNIPLIWLTKYVSYRHDINPLVTNNASYQPIADNIDM